jgi:hypothetical protein
MGCDAGVNFDTDHLPAREGAAGGGQQEAPEPGADLKDALAGEIQVCQDGPGAVEPVGDGGTGHPEGIGQPTRSADGAPGDDANDEAETDDWDKTTDTQRHSSARLDAAGRMDPHDAPSGVAV